MQNQTDTRLETVVDSIKQDIIFGRLRPRERLVEDQLTERFGASRHQVRMAFATLEQMGLVMRRPNKGAMVRDFSVEEVEEIYEMRAMLQGQAAQRVPMPAPKDLLERLEQIHEQYCAAADEGALQRVCKLNNEFHREIFEASNNQCLADMIERIWVQTLGIRCYAIGDSELLARARREHGEMIELLRAGNREAFVELCVDHIWPALEAYKRAHGGWTLRKSA
ncbi:MAG: GntR family transcriptional regulator [Rhodospirillaceae bacterium]|nr:GntR family transcriptional regulator [Rhodospirillaceae bacterium]